MIHWKVLVTKITTKVVLEAKVFKKEEEMIWRLLDDHKDTGCHSGAV